MLQSPLLGGELRSNEPRRKEENPTNRLFENAVEIAETQEDGLVTIFRILLVRDLANHREFTLQEIADEMGCSTNWASQILSGRLALRGQDFLGQLTRTEDAITRLTDKRGVLCPCSESSREDARAILALSNVTREVFGDKVAA